MQEEPPSLNAPMTQPAVSNPSGNQSDQRKSVVDSGKDFTDAVVEFCKKALFIIFWIAIAIFIGWLGYQFCLWTHRPTYTANDFQSPEGLNPAQAQNLNEMVRVCNVQTGTPSVCRSLFLHGNTTAAYQHEEVPPKEQG